jgi:hypothetical protein
LSADADESTIESLPIIEELPDPLRMNDGRRVKTAAAWRDRRDEIREMLLRYQYGHVPPSPENVALDAELDSDIRHDGRTRFYERRLKMGPGLGLGFRLQVYIPADGTPPYPAVLRIGLGREAAAEMNERGYVFACFEHRDLEPDTEGYDVSGPAQTAYPDYDWGALAVWAWGASRALDYLETLPEVRADQVVITGHSRCGKTALLAGALDERFAIVVPNGSGCGGAGCYRIANKGAETLALITSPKRFKSWFHEDFGRFGRHETRLPFDQHFVKALVAPRPLLSTDALGDTWANPVGTQASHLAAQPVYDLLGANENNCIHFREGGHDQLLEDFRALLDFADLHFRGKPTSRNLHVLPFDRK